MTQSLQGIDAELLRQIADRQAITDLIYRYCRAVDRLDEQLGASIWHEGGEADFGLLFKGTGQGWMAFTCKAHREQILTHQHRMSNIVIELDGDRAASESYVLATVRMMQEGQLKQWMLWGRYLDEWSRRDDRWGIDKRLYVDDFAEVRDVVPEGVELGRRDRSDPSYAVLR